MSSRNWQPGRLALTIVVVVGLAVDAFVHLHLASSYAVVKSGTLSQADLFYAEGVVAAIAAVALLVRPRRYTVAFAFLVSAAGTAAVLLYAYVDVGPLGPVPNMYEPVWYFEKTLSVWAEAIAALAALGLLVMLEVTPRRSTHALVK